MAPNSPRCGACSIKTRQGSNHNSWKGGKVTDSSGYIKVWNPSHPRATNRRYVLEHILVMEENIGRSLLPGENVHHKNGIRSDNRVENLELWVTLQPTGQRPEDLVKWAKEILERYEPSD